MHAAGRPGQRGRPPGIRADVDLYALVEAVSAATVGGLAAGEAGRRYWRRREARHEAAFRAAVERIIGEKMAELAARQAEAERRQGQHLDRQDNTLRQLQNDLAQLVRRGTGGPRGR